MSRDHTGCTGQRRRSIFCKVTFSDTEGGQINIISSVLSTTFQEEGENIEVGGNRLDRKALACGPGQVYKGDQPSPPPPSLPPLKEPGSLPGKNNNIVIWGSLQSVFQCILSDQARDFSHEDGSFIYLHFLYFIPLFFSFNKELRSKDNRLDFFLLKKFRE